MKYRTFIACCGALQATLAATPLAMAQAAIAQTQLPGGAQTINETYQDWQVTCTQPQGVKRCAVSQQQMDDKTKQRVLAVELQPRGDKAEGVLALPFGLAIDKGVSLKIGEAEAGLALRFKTCLPQGCIVPLSFDAKTMALLRKASAVTVGTVGDTDQPVAFSISLGGFAPAFDRAATLAR
jgi:invasion protein IalB